MFNFQKKININSLKEKLLEYIEIASNSYTDEFLNYTLGMNTMLIPTENGMSIIEDLIKENDQGYYYNLDFIIKLETLINLDKEVKNEIKKLTDKYLDILNISSKNFLGVAIGKKADDVIRLILTINILKLRRTT